MSKQQQALFETEPRPWQMDDERDWLAARVVFSKSPFGPYDYSVPDHLRNDIKPGKRVQVPLGRGNRQLDGYCVEVISSHHEQSDSVDPQRLKPITQIIDDVSLITPNLLKLAQWISYRWHCSLGVTLETIVPTAVRSQMNTREVIFLEVDASALAAASETRLPKKQLQALEALSESATPLTPSELANRAGCTIAPITALRKKGLVRESSRRVEQQMHSLPPEKRVADLDLNGEQSNALDQIVSGLNSEEHQSILLHGITGSGKTEVYIQAIRRVVEFGRQAIVLVPEISLTPQTRQRFCERFDSVAVLHSNLTGAQRAWHWRQIAEGKVQVVIGARSAVFAPVPRLGLVILDEEHDSSFKQDQIPRYHARDVARRRADQEQVPLVLGSATPSLESWHLAAQKKNRLIQLPNRIHGRPLPHVEIVDLRGEFAQRSSRGIISRRLHMSMRQTLDENGQVILLLNRRGFATNIQCPSCGHVIYCPDCAIAMTHHRDRKFIMCHYCDHRQAEPKSCPECGFSNIQFWGIGTQKLEQEVLSRFPNAPCVRMDTDSMQRPGSHEKALAEFRAGERRILVGTQMIAKGLDFPNVTLVGVVNADTALHLHDFRAGERTFTLVTQVAGRTGRGPKGGNVIVQTFNPDHPSIRAAAKHDFASFAEVELEHRKEFGYPPFGTLARFIIRSPQEHLARQMAETLGNLAREQQPDDSYTRVVGPAEAPISKLRGKFRFHFILKTLEESSMHQWIDSICDRAQDIDDVQYVVDVDPQDML